MQNAGAGIPTITGQKSATNVQSPKNGGVSPDTTKAKTGAAGVSALDNIIGKCSFNKIKLKKKED